jgi:hypothetical protein
MTESTPLHALVEDYLNGTLDEARMAELEDRLRADPDARRYFVRCARLHTDLHLELRARQASERVLDAIDLQAVPARRRRWPAMLAVAAGLLIAAAVGWGAVRGWAAPDATVAWLVNAQNCTWADGEPPGDLRAGKTLRIDRGLAELRFRCGARVVLEGPARLELLSDKSARLRSGKLTARVPPEAVGFEVLSAQGTVIDLGTEFGMAVADGGATEVVVFEGKVEAHPAGKPADGGVSVTRNQAARIAAGQVTVRPADPDAGRFVRAIVPAPVAVPRTRRLTFDRSIEGSINDTLGVGTGLTHRLPGTGGWFAERDGNLRLVPDKGQLELTTTNSDLNTQFRLRRGEYLGLRLSDLGFTGSEDFEVSATFPAIPALEFVGQFGLYAGAGSLKTIRGGLLSSRRQEAGQYTQFLVNNPDGTDTDVYKVGLLTTGTDLRMALRRQAGQYTLTVENLTSGGASTLTIRHPAFLDGEPDLYVGLFGANTQSEVRRTLVVKEFQATVWATATDR